MSTIPDMADAPFHCPADIVLDLPPPVSVNKTRRIDWNGHQKVKDWSRLADQFLICAKAAKQVRFDRIPRYELHITLSEDHCKIDADNGLKLIIDYLRKREITADDGPNQLRKIVVEWGFAAAGAKVIIRPCE
jgi:Holliday junction resolvase RusA-like endonuclease